MPSNEMQLAREILVYNQPKQKFHIFQTATDKWSEVAELIKNCPELEVSSLDNMRAVVQSTENTLELPNALIPEGSQKIFLFEAKVKSGAKKKAGYYDDFSFTDLRRVAKTEGITGLGSNPTKDALIEALEDASGIKKEKVTKTGRTGKIRITTLRTESPRTKEKVEKFKAIASTKPTTEEQLSALQTGFANFIEGLYAVCSDFVKPSITIETKVAETSVTDLEKESKGLKLPK